MTDEIDIKYGIATMYSKMAIACEKHSKAIKSNIDEYTIKNLKIGYEFETLDKGNYILICELKELKKDD